ncbi:MAG: hypothetical protein BGP07_08665 [Rhizobiales bacterium 63-22]|nr:MAG: hypothetical protein BGP07_08665 [Rhizobiales bacterium 63-22]
MGSICIVDADGVVMKEAKVASEPDDLVAFFAQCGMTMKRIGLEAGAPSQWLYGGMAEAGLPVVCIDTRHARAALSATQQSYRRRRLASPQVRITKYKKLRYHIR